MVNEQNITLILNRKEVSMPRITRENQKTITNTYHIIIRGVNKQDIFFDENSYNTIYTLKATKPYYLDEGGTSYKPTLELYHQYLEDASKLSNAEKNCVYYYYITAVNNIVDSNKINEYLMNDCLKLIDDGNVNYSNLEKLKAYIIACNSDQK